MTKQTDQLLLFDLESHGEEQAAAPVSSADIDRVKQRLRALDDLSRHTGWQIVKEALNLEAQYCLASMDKAENPTLFTKYGANYYSLTMAVGYVDTEMRRLRALLQSYGKTQL